MRVVALIGFFPVSLAATQCSITICEDRGGTSAYTKSLAVNAALGGLSAGLLQASNGGSFIDGLARGILGGSVVFAGKAVAGSEFSGAGLLGRQIAGIGNSVVDNAAAGRGLLTRLTLPAGPLPARVALTLGSGWSVQPMVDVASAGAMVYGMFTSYFDWGDSFSSGAAVFRQAPRRYPRTPVAVQPGRFVRGATTIGGVIFVSARGEEFYDEILRHERIHVLQFDAVVAALGDRADTWFFARYPTFDRYVKANLLAGLAGAVNQTMFALSDRSRLPWEIEARLFSGN